MFTVKELINLTGYDAMKLRRALLVRDIKPNKVVKGVLMYDENVVQELNKEPIYLTKREIMKRNSISMSVFNDFIKTSPPIRTININYKSDYPCYHAKDFKKYYSLYLQGVTLQDNSNINVDMVHNTIYSNY